MAGILSDLTRNLVRLFKICAFKKLDRNDSEVNLSVQASMVSLCLASTAAYDFATAGNQLSFNEWGLASFMATFAIFSVGITISSKRGKPVPLGRAIADYAGITAIVALLYTLSVLVWRQFSKTLYEKGIPVETLWVAFYWLVFIWMLAVFWRAGTHLWQHPRRWPGLKLIAAVYMPLVLVPHEPIIEGSETNWSRLDIWYWSREAFFNDKETTLSEVEAPKIDFETILYGQSAMVGKALSSLRSSQSDAPQFYFLGMATSSAQSVFRKEVTGAREVFDARLGSKGRSMVLINSAETTVEFPLASVSNMRQALLGMASVMRPEKDVLALYITSHGNDGLISVSMPGFPFNEIRPEVLSSALDEAGIKNRVIILSACYSGSFIPALEGNDTLIMTAASATTTSFGCSNELDWTYFGNALFNHGLKNTISLTNAFAIARQTIGKWESEQGLPPSDPQISLGVDIAKVLETMNGAGSRGSSETLQ